MTKLEKPFSYYYEGLGWAKVIGYEQFDDDLEPIPVIEVEEVVVYEDEGQVSG